MHILLLLLGHKKVGLIQRSIKPTVRGVGTISK